MRVSVLHRSSFRDTSHNVPRYALPQVVSEQPVQGIVDIVQQGNVLAMVLVEVAKKLRLFKCVVYDLLEDEHVSETCWE